MKQLKKHIHQTAAKKYLCPKSGVLAMMLTAAVTTTALAPVPALAAKNDALQTDACYTPASRKKCIMFKNNTPQTDACYTPVTLNKSKATLYTKQKITLKLKNAPKLKHFTWKSSNPKVASVNQKGVVTAKSKGTAKITLSYAFLESCGSKTTSKVSCNVTVHNQPVHVTSDVAYITEGDATVIKTSAQFKKWLKACQKIDQTRAKKIGISCTNETPYYTQLSKYKDSFFKKNQLVLFQLPKSFHLEHFKQSWVTINKKSAKLTVKMSQNESSGSILDEQYDLFFWPVSKTEAKNIKTYSVVLDSDLHSSKSISEETTTVKATDIYYPGVLPNALGHHMLQFDDLKALQTYCAQLEAPTASATDDSNAVKANFEQFQTVLSSYHEDFFTDHTLTLLQVDNISSEYALDTLKLTHSAYKNGITNNTWLLYQYLHQAPACFDGSHIIIAETTKETTKADYTSYHCMTADYDARHTPDFITEETVDYPAVGFYSNFPSFPVEEYVRSDSDDILNWKNGYLVDALAKNIFFSPDCFRISSLKDAQDFLQLVSQQCPDDFSKFQEHLQAYTSDFYKEHTLFISAHKTGLDVDATSARVTFKTNAKYHTIAETSICCTKKSETQHDLYNLHNRFVSIVEMDKGRADRIEFYHTRLSLTEGATTSSDTAKPSISESLVQTTDQSAEQPKY